MRVCLMIEGQEGVTWELWRGLATACERHGLEGMFRSDHYASFHRGDEFGALDAWATLAGLAAVTDRIRLGTLVSPVTFRHPSELAKVVVTVDHISGGRVELGLGAGWNEREHRAYGFEFPGTPERLERFAEQLELVRLEWTESGLDFSGRWYSTESLTALPRPVQRPAPHLIVGGMARPGTVEPAVRLADEYNTVYVTPDEAAERRAVIDESCRRQGRDPGTMAFSVMTGCVLGRDEAEVRERAERVRARTNREGDVDDFLRASSDRWVIGTPDGARDHLARLERAGVERIYLQHLDHEDLESVELMGELV